MSCEVSRLDKWLWHARFAKTRALAQKLIESGQVSVNGRIASKTSTAVRPGHIVAVIVGPVRRTVTVRGAGQRRGPPAEARTLYEETRTPERLNWEEAGAPRRKR